MNGLYCAAELEIIVQEAVASVSQELPCGQRRAVSNAEHCVVAVLE